MDKDALKSIIEDAHKLAKADIAPDLIRPAVETIALRLERLVKDGFYVTPEAAREFDALLMILNMRDPARCRFRTHFTTNLTNDELVENFDARVVDRIYGLAKCFRIETEESRREAVAFL